MSSIRPNPEWTADDVAAELTAVALPVAQRHGTRRNSVDVELAVWQALAGALKTCRAAARRPAALADAAYRALLGVGFRGSFADLELDLWRAFRAAPSA
jgi:hypothetical protein